MGENKKNLANKLDPVESPGAGENTQDILGVCLHSVLKSSQRVTDSEG